MATRHVLAEVGVAVVAHRYLARLLHSYVADAGAADPRLCELGGGVVALALLQLHGIILHALRGISGTSSNLHMTGWGLIGSCAALHLPLRAGVRLCSGLGEACLLHSSLATEVLVSSG